jgi:uncharacterized protein YfaS (alpha-2-macroglobulin family)
MTKADPFASWNDDYKQAQSLTTAAQVRQLRENEHQAGRHLKEALTYYQSQQWTVDGVEAEALDTLLNQLRQARETAATLRQQAETNLGKLLHSQRPFEDAATLTQRHADMVRAATPPAVTKDTVEPSPLESFLSARTPKAHQPTLLPRKAKARTRSL